MINLNAALADLEGPAVRTHLINGAAWFVAADVARTLDIDDTADALRRLAEDDQALVSIEGSSKGDDKVNVINESGLYTLVKLDSSLRTLLRDELARLIKIAETLFPDPTRDERTGETQAQRFAQNFEDRILEELRLHRWNHFATADLIYLRNKINQLKGMALQFFDERRDLEHRYTEWMTNPTVHALPRKGSSKFQVAARNWFDHI